MLKHNGEKKARFDCQNHARIVRKKPVFGHKARCAVAESIADGMMDHVESESILIVFFL